MSDQGKEDKTPGTWSSTPHEPEGIAKNTEVEQQQAGTNNDFIKEYEALRVALGLTTPIISYPACGDDISLSRVFPQSDTYYIDPDIAALEAIKAAGLQEETTHLVAQSAYNYKSPQPVDLVVLRNASTDNDDTVGLTRGLKKGGYVIESHWGSTVRSRDLLADPNFALVGRFALDKDMEGKVVLNTNTNEIAKKLAEDTGVISQYAGRGYVFQKKS